MIPKKELKSVVIKQQHNAQSFHKNYNGNFIPIVHEYLLIWQKSKATMIEVMFQKAKDLKQSINSTWKNIIRIALLNLGGQSPLEHIYKEIEKIASQRIQINKNYKAKVRQQLQYHFSNVERGVWGL